MLQARCGSQHSTRQRFQPCLGYNVGGACSWVMRLCIPGWMCVFDAGGGGGGGQR
jgi:hypothetical protein